MPWIAIDISSVDVIRFMADEPTWIGWGDNRARYPRQSQYAQIADAVVLPADWSPYPSTVAE